MSDKLIKVSIYTDGACLGNPGPGGWAAIIYNDTIRTEIAGRDDSTTNNRMEILAAIKGLEAAPEAFAITVYSDSQYLVNTMTKNWKRQKNIDLWDQLDALVSSRDVSWKWVKGHAGHPDNEEADRLATNMAHSSPEEKHLTHLDSSGQAHMVNVGNKLETAREAVAKGFVSMQPQTLDLVKQGAMDKGDVISIARIAGIMAAKQTSTLIPLCHPLPLDQVTLDIKINEIDNRVDLTATSKTTAKTGVEMESLTAVSIAALTIYDMCKSVDKGMRIDGIRLVRKTGGKSGDILLE